MPNGLTVLIPCKDEASNIRACIDSARSVADELLIADSGSTDGTLQLVRDDPDCRLIEREFVDSGNFKNWAIPQAACPWVFVLDADERITPQLASELRQLVNAGPRRQGYWVYRNNYFLGHRMRHTSWGNDRVIRLIHRDAGRYQEHTDHAEICLPPSQTGTLKHRLIHYTCWNYRSYLPKMFRYAEQQAALWDRQGRRASVRRLVGNGPLRFLRSYIAELGFLDGAAGLQVSILTGFYSFLKQATLWQIQHGRQLRDLEPTERLPGELDEHRDLPHRGSAAPRQAFAPREQVSAGRAPALTASETTGQRCDSKRCGLPA